MGHIFKLEQKEYTKEDIEWSNLKFSDNQDILDVLAGKPCNLLALIDEESNFPKVVIYCGTFWFDSFSVIVVLVFKSNDGFGMWQGTDVTLLSKMNKQHKGNKIYVASKSEHDTDFGIHHYAGVVHYDSTGTPTNCNDS